MAVRAPQERSAAEVFREERERIAAAQRRGASGIASVRALAGAVDLLVEDVWRTQQPGEGVAVVATGGYGRGELSPGSDIDIMVLCSRKTEAASASAKNLFYVLWDTGMKVGHGLRTHREALRLARTEFDAETAFLDARLIAGDAGVFERFRQKALERSRDGKFLLRLRAATRDRRARAGDASAELEPHLKEGRGGLRDLASIGWIRTVGEAGFGLLPPDRDLAAPAETLHRVRNALHLTGDASNDRLLMHLQAKVAGLLGHDASAAKAEVDLMRDLYAACRRIAFSLDLLLDPATAEARSSVDPEGFALEGWTPAARAKFRGVLLAGEEGRPALLALDEAGAIVRCLPEWEGIWCLPQGNVYHRYAVDIHSFESVVELVRLASGSGLIARVASDEMQDPEVLLLATLFHDIGKGTDGDHTVVGEHLAAAAARRIGLSGDDAAEIAWLVRNHLLLSETATRRNIRDERLVIELAERVGSPKRLRRLFLISAADGLATGPEAWGPWKAALVEELFSSVHNVLERGELVAGGATALARERASELAAALAGRPGAEEHIDGMPRAWILDHPVENLVRHSAAMLKGAGSGFHLEVSDEGDGETWEIIFVGRDMPGLVGKVSGVLALHGLDVRSAHIYTRSDGVALEIFHVHPVGTEDRRFRRVEEDLRKVMRGRIALELRLAEKRKGYSAKIPRGKRERPRVVVNNSASDFYTVIEVHASDEIGLLHSITQALAELSLDIHLAKVATYAEDVVDVFYVTDLDGQKVEDPEHATEVENMILHRLARAD